MKTEVFGDSIFGDPSSTLTKKVFTDRKSMLGWTTLFPFFFQSLDRK